MPRRRAGQQITEGAGGDARPGSGGFRVSRGYTDQHPDADPSATELAINVLYIAELLGRRADHALRPFGLTRGSHNVLQILGGVSGPLTPTDVAARVVATSATITGLLDTLESRGLAARRRHPADRRSVLVEITAKGRQLLDELVPQLIEHEKRWEPGSAPTSENS
jgi:DNA-binding MarR family transcriptional regulator